LLRLALAGLLAAAGYVVFLDHVVRSRFEGTRWALPAHVYARPLELYPGLDLSDGQFEEELQGLGYRQGGLDRPGSYLRQGPRIEVHSRAFAFWDGSQPPRRFAVSFSDGAVADVRPQSGQRSPLTRLDPALIGSIHPSRHEDRELVRLPDVPSDLVATLIAVEDRDFHTHHGLDVSAIARALLANLRARRAVQGGSTLTQQLVKNFYLDSERSLWRKLNEAIMAVLLEVHYGKDEILEAYINEIYLGQQGNRAIHGFGLASRFYFQRPLHELRLDEHALLVAVVRGPSYYNPRRHPQRALERRNSVLEQTAELGFIEPAALRAAISRPLGVTDRADLGGGDERYGAFVDLVRTQLRRDYSEDALRGEGLRVFTTLDPVVQHSARQAVSETLGRLETQRSLPAGTLEAAVIVTRNADGEVLALLGGRPGRTQGFNRALDARRPIGSLAKPAVYLAALSRPERYTLATLIDDAPLTVRNAGAAPWSPRNYDGRSHGRVPLFAALSHSYNVATARLGMEIGVGRVVDTLHRLGVQGDIPAYPSTILGAAGTSVLDVAQMYQTLAGGGFRVPLRAVSAVLTAANEPLKRYPLDIEATADPAAVYLLTAALQEVVRNGTAAGLSRWLPPALGVAGKTGTTDDFRDSWFAGFSGDVTGVVWIGRDDNAPVGLSGAAGALAVYGDMMKRMSPQPLAPAPPEGIETAWIDPVTGGRSGPQCDGAVELPFVAGTAPREPAPCGPNRDRAPGPLMQWLDRLFR
jgi:penicillin-binding protein 1B